MTMKIGRALARCTVLAVGGFALAVSGVAWSQDASTRLSPDAASAIGHDPQFLIAAVPARRGASLKVTSPAFPADANMPLINTQYGRNRFPGLSW
ncbi:hypothetical protein AB4Z00_12670 [Novosphingobium sp. YAF33]